MPELTFPCIFKNNDEKRKAISAFLRKYGDDLPEETIQDAVTDKQLDKWEVVCDEKNDLIAGVTYFKNDWYLCTLHYLAVASKYRGKKIGTLIAERILAKLLNDADCHVLAGDITYDNYPSYNIFLKLGFKPVSTFCWRSGQKPAYIVQYVRKPEGTGHVCP